jgi:hypothetical protein
MLLVPLVAAVIALPAAASRCCGVLAWAGLSPASSWALLYRHMNAAPSELVMACYSSSAACCAAALPAAEAEASFQVTNAGVDEYKD